MGSWDMSLIEGMNETFNERYIGKKYFKKYQKYFSDNLKSYVQLNCLFWLG